MNKGAVSTRQATERDEQFLKEVFFEIRSPEFALAELSRRQLQRMLGTQFRTRTNQFAGVFPAAQYRILMLDQVDAGYLLTAVGPELTLLDIAVRPLYQNQGVATAALKALLAEADAAGQSVSVTVEIFNPARRLFERLGFQAYEDSGIYKRMRRPTGSP